MASKNSKHKFRFTYDNKIDGVVTVRNTSGQGVHFIMYMGELQYHNNKNCHVTLVQTVSENEAGYIERQLKSAKLATELYTKVMHPS